MRLANRNQRTAKRFVELTDYRCHVLRTPLEHSHAAGPPAEQNLQAAIRPNTDPTRRHVWPMQVSYPTSVGEYWRTGIRITYWVGMDDVTAVFNNSNHVT